MKLLWFVAALPFAACSFNGGGVVLDDNGGAPDARPHGGGDDAPDAAVELSPDAAVVHSNPGELRSMPAPTTMNIDGNDAEYANAPAISFEIQNGRLYQAVSGYTPSAAVTLRAIHDDAHLYFFAHVDDSIIKVDSPDAWNDDGVTLFLDVADDASGPYAEDDHALVVRADGTYTDYGPVGTSANLTVATARPNGGYDIEVQVDDDSLSSTVGSQVGFDLLLTDDDGVGGDTNYDASSLWYQSSRPACPDCCQNGASPWCDTTMYGKMMMQ
jgi:hypothetical protein